MSQYSRYSVHTISNDTLPNLDFSKIEAISGLNFDKVLRLDLQIAAREYLNYKDAYQNIDAKDVKKYFDKVIKAIDTLVPVLACAYPGADPEINDKPVLQAVWKHSRPYNSLHPDEYIIKRYLNDWRKQALMAKDMKGRPGQPRDIALPTFIAYHAHPIYLKAGGVGIGCAANLNAANHYSGQFYDLVCEVLRQVDGHVMAPSGVGKVICETLKGKN